MGWDLVPPLATVKTNGPHGVDGEPLVWVDSNAEEAGVSVDEPLHISLLKIEEDGGVVEISQTGHILATVILRRVDLCNQVLLILLHVPFVLSVHDLHLHLVSVCLLYDPLAELLHLMGHVAGPLRVVGLLSNLLLQLSRDEEVRCRIRIVSRLELYFSSGHLDSLL